MSPTQAVYRYRSGLVSSVDVLAATGVTYRMLDYWCRNGVITPVVAARGSGSQRAFSTEQVWLCRALSIMAGLGARRDALRALVAAVGADPALWDGRVVVGFDDKGTGWVVRAAGRDDSFGGYVIDLRSCADSDSGSRINSL